MTGVAAALLPKARCNTVTHARGSRLTDRVFRDVSARRETPNCLLTPPTRHGIILRAGLGHALDFQTWRLLVRQQGLGDEQATEVVLAMVRCLVSGKRSLFTKGPRTVSP